MMFAQDDGNRDDMECSVDIWYHSFVKVDESKETFLMIQDGEYARLE